MNLKIFMTCLMIPLTMMNYGYTMEDNVKNNIVINDNSTKYYVNNRDTILLFNNGHNLCSLASLNQLLSVMNPGDNEFFRKIQEEYNKSSKLITNDDFKYNTPKPYLIILKVLLMENQELKEQELTKVLQAFDEEYDRLFTNKSFPQSLRQLLKKYVKIYGQILPNNTIDSIIQMLCYPNEEIGNRYGKLDSLLTMDFKHNTNGITRFSTLVDTVETQNCDYKTTEKIQNNKKQILNDYYKRNIANSKSLSDSLQVDDDMNLIEQKNITTLENFTTEKNKEDKPLNVLVDVSTNKIFNKFRNDINTGELKLNNKDYELRAIAFHSTVGYHYLSAKKLSDGKWGLIDSLPSEVKGYCNNLKELLDIVTKNGLLPRSLLYSQKENGNVNNSTLNLNNIQHLSKHCSYKQKEEPKNEIINNSIEILQNYISQLSTNDNNNQNCDDDIAYFKCYPTTEDERNEYGNELNELLNPHLVYENPESTQIPLVEDKRFSDKDGLCSFVAHNDYEELFSKEWDGKTMVLKTNGKYYIARYDGTKFEYNGADSTFSVYTNDMTLKTIHLFEEYGK
ncbi:MAG: hypothetical protein IJ848_01865 [Alphaproteobacteria bacterium]|nr:hypothetical protein [Alphaproteobacteria bacterium]